MPKTNLAPLSADDIDRVIALSRAAVLADPTQALTAREAMLRVRDDQASKGASAELLNRLDRFFLELVHLNEDDARLASKPFADRVFHH